MKFSLAILPAILGATLAAPAEEAQKRQITQVSLTFYGAADGQYTIFPIPTDGTPVAINNPLSVSRIGQVCGAQCFATGAEEGDAQSFTRVACGRDSDVGPPQRQVSVFCRRL
ncbi:MAG: hypothetical protein LQ351_001681 [Letrouitia transgressa]|nr:MAG: hypothetical protein LQ351_001681 [Letrouitia transgressa]